MLFTKRTIFCVVMCLVCIGLYSYVSFTAYKIKYTPFMQYRTEVFDHNHHNSTCKNLLQQGEFIKDTWHPTGCTIHNYTKQDLQACLSKHSQRKQNPYFIAFVGDSTFRQRYTSLIWLLLDKPADTWIDKPFHHYDNYSNTKFLYYTIDTTSSGNKMITYLRNWNTNFESESPDILFVGFNYHVAIDGCGNHACDRYKAQVKSVADILSSHKETHSVWVNAGPVNITNISTFKGGGAKVKWRRQIAAYDNNLTTPIDEYNKHAASVISNTTIPLCTVLGKVKEHFVSKTWRHDGIHMGLEGLIVVRNIIINYSCNSIMDFSDGTCCAR